MLFAQEGILNVSRMRFVRERAYHFLVCLCSGGSPSRNRCEFRYPGNKLRLVFCSVVAGASLPEIVLWEGLGVFRAGSGGRRFRGGSILFGIVTIRAWEPAR